MHANYTAGCKIKDTSAPFQRINLGCFTQSPLGTFGNVGRNTLRQPGINNWDMGFGKAFGTERYRFKLNVDTFNTFNHHQYAGDVGALITGGSGGNEVIAAGVGTGDATAGKITGSSSPRILQLSGKITF
jgi:hypothetical protein